MKEVQRFSTKINGVKEIGFLDEDSNFVEKKITMNFKLTRVEKRRIREVELTILSE